MTTGMSTCETCAKEFKWRKCNNYLKTPKYCSMNCRKYENQSREQILEKLKNSFEKDVIRKDGCWGWKGKINKGYAGLSCSSKTGYQYASRASYVIHKSDIPENMLVCHSCDNPKCTNPEHLFLGYPKDNSKDMTLKNRQAKGSRVAAAKLNEEKVKEIKCLFETKTPMKEIAKKYGVYISVIEKIKSGTSWKHVGVNV